jgi:hypothetical protein
MKILYNHVVDLATTVISEREDGSDVTPAMVRTALLKRIAEIPDNELMESGLSDTYETTNVEVARLNLTDIIAQFRDNGLSKQEVINAIGLVNVADWHFSS